MTAYDKPYLSFDEQVLHLHSEYGLIIQDKSLGATILQSISYYDLINGYKECFMINNAFEAGTSLDELYQFYKLDRDIQKQLLSTSAKVETRFKNILAHIMAKNFGVDVSDYLNPIYYKKNKNANKILSDLIALSTDTHVLNPTRHYQRTKNHIPPWILMKNATFNNSIDLFKEMNSQYAAEVCEELVPRALKSNYKKEFANNALIIVRKFRNKIAHNLKFITFRTSHVKQNKVVGEQIIVKNLSHVYKGTLIEGNDFKEKRGRNDPYAMILCLISLLREPFLVADFIESIILEINRIKSLPNGEDAFNRYCSISGIPFNIDRRLTRLYREIIK
ncbi:Abi family protein [Peptoniphilus sp. EMRHCC_23]|uniref:Abi family protein n=1 Tax=Peptoniphilus rachelemmaiella TaxID=2811779 RepID=UPI001C0052C8|nr:Abi family protein [Peptoniphilus rachelemmaiella]